MIIMAIIDPDGLFNGDRLRQCSDMARLHWPYLFLAANGYGRFEVNYRRIATAVYVDFHHPPTEEEFYGYIGEYRRRHLLFLYEARDQIWGQWDCKPGSLKRHKTAKDRTSPEPPMGAFDSWIRSYRNSSKPLPKDLEIFKNLPKSSEKFLLGVGVGEGVGEGGGKNKESPPSGGELVLCAPPDRPPRDWKTRRFEEFWGIVWTKTGKDDAQKAFNRKVKSDGMAVHVIEIAVRDGPRLLREATEQCRSAIHPATWLNKGRYEDVPPVETSPNGGHESALMRVMREREAEDAESKAKS